MNKCKLCGSKNLVVLETYSSHDIINKYKETFNIEVSYFFPRDNFYKLKCLDCDICSYSEVKAGDSKFYEFIAKNSAWYYASNKPEFLKAIEYISTYKPKKILEIGAGYGFFLEKLKNTFDVKASEINNKALQELKLKGIALDTMGEKYDFIFMFQVLEHIENLASIFTLIDSKLKKNGFVFITVPNPEGAYLSEVFDILDFPPHHMHQFSRKSLLKLGDILNYEVVDYYEEELSIEHYYSIIKSRRKRLMTKSNKFSKKIFNLFSIFKLFSVFDIFIGPYFYNKHLPGHTHGILLKKT